MNQQTYQEEEQQESIAIIGMSGKFPGANDINQFWHNICAGVDSITHFTTEQLLEQGIDAATINQPNYVKANPIIDDIDKFDARFFGYSPIEAKVIAPHHRLFLECGWQALEHAGYCSANYQGLIGVYAGTSMNTYFVNNLYPNSQMLEQHLGGAQFIQGVDKDYLATALSYKLNLEGPSVDVQSFCSTSLVAVHMACQSLLSYECDMAISGGVSAKVPQIKGYFHQQGGIFSANGQCRPFDQDSSGTLFGNGIGVVVLKRLEDAIAQNDTIYAQIRGSAINNDGALRASFSAPSLEGQAKVIAQALSTADVPADSIDYIEAHGTGTSLGDPIEISALTKAFRLDTDETQYCAIGSVKANIGHLEPAAGVVGLIKTALMLHHQTLTPSIHFNQPNPNIDFDQSPFYVNTELKPWPQGDSPRRAGVSSFGIGGTNAHVVLEQAPQSYKSYDRSPHQSVASNSPQLLILSAKTDTALAQMAVNLATALEKSDSPCLADVAYTLQLGRDGFNHRHILVSDNLADAAAKLRQINDRKQQSREQQKRNPAVILSLNGAQAIPAITAIKLTELYQQQSAFQSAFDQCAEQLQSLISVDIRTLINSPQQAPLDTSSAPIDAAIRFTLEYAYTKQWLVWGITPSNILAAGLGGFIAPCLAEMISLGDALELAILSVSDHTAYQAKTAALNVNSSKINWYSQSANQQVNQGEYVNTSHWHQISAEAAPHIEPLTKDKHSIVMPALVEPSAKEEPSAEKEPSAQKVPSAEKDALNQMLNQLGELWLAGIDIDWQQLHQAGRRRVPLPTYPFERQSYWIAPPKQYTAAQDIATDGDIDALVSQLHATSDQPKQANPADWFYLPSWQHSAVDSQISPQPHSQYLVFTNDDALSTQVVEKLQQAQYPVVVVQQGDFYAKQSENHYVINSANAADYVALLSDIANDAPQPMTKHVLHFCNVGEQVTDLPLTQTLTPSFYGLLYLVQALDSHSSTQHSTAEASDLLVFSDQMQEVGFEAQQNPFKAAILSMINVTALEYPNIRCRSIDLIKPQNNPQIASQVQQIWHEIHSQDHERVIAYRANHRLKQRFDPIPFGEAQQSISRLKTQGCYLITGGLGQIALQLATHLFTRYQAKLILVDIAALPQDSQTTAEAHPATQCLTHLKQQRAQIEVFQADVADLAQMRQIFNQSGDINGVIHAAGQKNKGTIVTKNTSNTAAALAAKVEAMLVLEQLINDKPVDFFIALSSIASIYGEFGEVEYCAANNVLNSLVKRLQHQGLFACAINYDRWQGISGETRPGLTIAEGLETFERILAAPIAQPWVLVTPYKLDTTLSHNDAFKKLSSQGALGEAIQQLELQPRPPLAQPYLAPHTDTQQALVDIWTKLIGIVGIGINDDFFDLGGDSISAISLIGKIQSQFAVNLTTAKIYEAATINQLAELIDAQAN